MSDWKEKHDAEIQAYKAVLTASNPDIGPLWSTDEAQDIFKFEGFCYGIAVVTRKEDGVRGSLNFTHQPRVYFGFVPDRR